MTDLIPAHIAHLKAEGYAETTVTHAEKFLRRLDQELPMGLEQSVEEELVNWLNSRKRSRQTRASYLGHMKRCLRFGTDPQRTSGPRLDFDASAGIKRPRVRRGLPRPVPEPHLTRLLTEQAHDCWSAEARHVHRAVHVASWVAYRGGLRCCEIVSLDLDSGDVDELRIRVLGKGGKVRDVPTHPDLWEILRDEPGGPLIRRPDGQPADAFWLSTNAARHFRFRLWLPAGVSMHPLRHTFATELLDAGVDIRVVQELLGHDSLLSTAIYTQVTSRQRQMAIRSLPALGATPR